MQVNPPPPPPPNKNSSQAIPPPPPPSKRSEIPPSPQEAQVLAEFNPWVKQRQAELQAAMPKFKTQAEADQYVANINNQFNQEQQQKYSQITGKYTLPQPTTQEGQVDCHIPPVLLVTKMIHLGSIQTLVSAQAPDHLIHQYILKIL